MCIRDRIDTFTPKKWISLAFVRYHVSMKTSFDFLNFNHRVCRNPTTYSITSKESFYDLYVKALKLSKKIIEDVYKRQLYFSKTYVFRQEKSPDGLYISTSSIFLVPLFITL